MMSNRLAPPIGSISFNKKALSIIPLTPQNGVKYYVLSLTRLVFNYCSHMDDSNGLREYLRKEFVGLAEANRSVEFVVEPKMGKRPVLRAFYLNKSEHVICVKNMNISEIREKVKMLRERSGLVPRKFSQRVWSKTEAVRPIWSPFHDNPNSPLLAWSRKTDAEGLGLETSSTTIEPEQ